MFLTDREKALDSSIGRNVRGNVVVSVNQDVAVVLIKKAGCLNAAHQVICIDAAGIPILTFNGNNRNIVGSQFFGGNGMAEDNEAFNVVGQQFPDIASFYLLLIASGKYDKFITVLLIAGQNLIQHLSMIVKIEIGYNDSDKFRFSACQDSAYFIFLISQLVQGAGNNILIFQCQRIGVIKISGDGSFGKVSVICNVLEGYLFFI